MKHFATIIGTRPQLIKYDTELQQTLIWTGQHYSTVLKDVFFKGLHIPKPNYTLNKTKLGEMIDGLTVILAKIKPDYVIVYGDCRSTLAGAVAANILNIPIIHIEAGCRSFNQNMIEERIRVAVDKMSLIHFAPSERNKEILEREGYTQVYTVGATQIDTMFSTFPTKRPKDAYKYKLMTLHRDFNVNKKSLENIFEGLKDGGKIELYIHPRTEKFLKGEKIKVPKNIKILKPLPYKQMINRVAFAEKIITDSGGLQVEAFILRRPCMTLRNDTEWLDTVYQGWNKLVGTDCAKIAQCINQTWYGKGEPSVYGNANAKKIIRTYLTNL